MGQRQPPCRPHTTPQHKDSTTRTKSTERIDSVEYVDNNARELGRVGGGGVDLDSASSRNPGVSDTEPGRGFGASIDSRNPGLETPGLGFGASVGSRNPGVSDTEPGRGMGTSIGSRNPGVSDTEPCRGIGTSIERGAGKELAEHALSMTTANVQQ